MKKLLAATAVLLLSACGGGDPAPELESPVATEKNGAVNSLKAKYAAILNEDFVLGGGAETSAEDVIALLPESLELTIGSSSYDAASGATIWERRVVNKR